MVTIGFSRRIWKRFFLVSLFILTIAGCRIFSSQPVGEPMVSISPLPLPQLPEWIKEISPTEEATSLGQIRITFSNPLIPVERLDSPNQRQQLKHFDINPTIPGRFRFLTPRMVGFQAEEAIPLATRFQVTLKKGLSDLSDHQLESDIAWTFNTPAIQLSNLPGTEDNPGFPDHPIGLDPTLKFTSNVELDLASVNDHIRVISDKTKKAIPLRVTLDKPEAGSGDVAREDRESPFSHSWDYNIKFQQKLEKASRYTLEITPGLQSKTGNLASQFLISNPIYTYEPLQFQGIQFYGQPREGGTYGRFTNGSPQLKFNNGITAQSARENITINPPPVGDAPPLIQSYDGNDTISLNPWSFQPQTNYVITIGANLEDTFNQRLEEPINLNYKTGNLAADLWTPSGLNIFPSGNNLQINVSTVNIPESRYQAAYAIIQPEDLVYAEQAYPSREGKNLLPTSDKWQNFRVDGGATNQTIETSINLRDKLQGKTGMLAYGIKAKTTSYEKNGVTEWNEPSFYGMVQLTNLGVFSQWFPESGMVRVNHLDDGSPVASASVEIYQSQLNARSFPQPTACARGITNREGLLLLTAENLGGCMGASRFNEPPELLVIAKEGEDWAFTRSYSYSGAYGYGVYAGWDENKPISRGTIFSDRQLYQPGEPIALTGVAYYLQNGELQPDQNTVYNLTLETPTGEKRELGDYSTNQFATFSVEFTVKPDDPLGNYVIQGKGINGVEIVGNFRVAEFNPPNFKVDLSLDRQLAVSQDKIMATVQGDYLFGSPVVGGEAKYYVTRTASDFTPPGWEKYHFGRQWFWPEEKPTISSDVLQRSQNLDAAGSGSEMITVSGDVPYPLRYQVDVEVTDVSNLSVADSQSFTVLPNHQLIGLKSKFVANVNQAFPVEVIVTDVEGKSINNVPVKLELQKMNYSSITRVVEGGQTNRNQLEYETVDTVDVRSGNTAKTVELTARESGSYRIQARFASDPLNTPKATDIQIWITGDSPVSWGNRYDNRLEIKLDRDNYQPGDIATALIQSPYGEGELFFAVIRDRILYKTLIPVKGGAPEIRFQVTPEMLPNVAVEAVLVRQGEPLSQLEPGSVDNLVSIGMTPLNVSKNGKYLQVKINPNQSEFQPGSQATINLELTKDNYQPISGQITLMVVNDAILQLNGYRPPNLVDTVYAEQSISTRLTDNRPDVVIQSLMSPLAKGWGYGGGFSAATIDTSKLRQDFQALAYYNGSIITDTQGKATVNFTLPDNLTTWRVLAIATDENLEFGSGEATFITTKSLLSNPILPPFARVGDRFLAGVSITNRDNLKGQLDITGDLSGGLLFSAGNKTSHHLKTQAETATQAYRFPVLVEQVGNSLVKFTSRLQNKTDSFQVPLEIKPLETTEQVIASGTTRETVSIPINIDDKVVPNAGGLTISLANSLIPQLTQPATQIFQQPTLPFLEPIASRLLIASNLQIIGKNPNDLSGLDLELQANDAINRLAGLQKEDGGFGYFPAANISDPLLSSYAAESLAKASQAGFTVNNNLINRLRNYLNQVVANPDENGFCVNNICKNRLRLEALIALSDLGETRSDFMAEIYGTWREFDPATQIKLAGYLANFPQWETEFNTIFQDIQKHIYQTGRTATVNLPPGYQWLASPTVLQSQALRLYITQNQQPETIGRLVESLLNLRREGIWQNDYDTAEALTALVAYQQTQTTSESFRVNLEVGGYISEQIELGNDGNSSFNLNLPMAELPQGNYQLSIQPENSGNLHYWIKYSYRLEGKQPGQLNGLRVIRTIRPANETESLQTYSLTEESKPLTVKPGQIFDIGLEIIADHPVDKVMIVDPLPAGLEAIDRSFETSNQVLQSQADSWEIAYQTIYRDRIMAYSDRLIPGAYHVHYLVRSVTPGEFIWPGARAYLQYNPEEFGRTTSGLLVVSDR
ncbi:alpha-2-macroglobulin family protein [Arthrospira platensis]|uniref:alpha-2-macroglobulin family protein n=1 Tax=Limnospira TaxID=2596745 RepID=UPI000557591D|nr:Ig-like domain-containing protein [Arthrospira platensis]AMW29934.1 hypothetical protein AP285_20360 [Arthrospira platensis YZ]MBD2671006.1 alpha-2-macroglobulin family protein [Arthrospira platensis FACHB-439]MBD2711764.1 alpha-2-macroglobulin family protein [Arthrospira platensis FACHB-835]MDT9184326.1 alpha-2-macroglobulin family protein [Limnospira sp. PMC 289.06]MDT9296763.1 alpha-2-macroglobulin family protein [Arthrospira platensis PCC 7345]MDT9312172.1 alpha-2-macroglobulin family 